MIFHSRRVNDEYGVNYDRGANKRVTKAKYLAREELNTRVSSEKVPHKSETGAMSLAAKEANTQPKRTAKGKKGAGPFTQ